MKWKNLNYSQVITELSLNSYIGGYSDSVRNLMITINEKLINKMSDMDIPETLFITTIVSDRLLKQKDLFSEEAVLYIICSSCLFEDTEKSKFSAFRAWEKEKTKSHNQEEGNTNEKRKTCRNA